MGADSGAGQDSGTDAGQTSDAGQDAGQDAGPTLVTFSYTPAWGGVTSVVVIGGFDAGVDWKAATPFATLTNDGAGNWTGTGTVPLLDGQYPYLFVAAGDDAGRSNTSHLALDPTNAFYTPCPAGSPTYTTQVANPCSLLTVPQPAPATLYHVTGTANYDGGAAAGYLALLEREEPGSHHFFVNRMDARADGTFDMQVAPGTYRVQVLYPTYYSQTDSQRDGLTLKAFLRTLSTPFPVATADRNLNPSQQALDLYDQYQPLDGGSPLPATFTFPIIPGAASAYAAIYGGMDGGLQSIGDPWWTGTSRTTTPASDLFDGGWNTTKATEPAARPGERYLWGTWQVFPRVDGGVQWTGESMVFPVIFQ